MDSLPTLVGLWKTFLSWPSGLLKEAQVGSLCEFKCSADLINLAEVFINQCIIHSFLVNTVSWSESELPLMGHSSITRLIYVIYINLK